MKVKLIKGMEEKGHEDHMIWIAGTIPVGEIGKILWSEDKKMHHVIWDNDAYIAKAGYIYGIGSTENIEDLFEIMEEV